jgi:GNAT superfamily N-acetyltransferase
VTAPKDIPVVRALSRLRAVFTDRADRHGRDVTAAAERWMYSAPVTEGGWQQLRVLDPTNYDFARLTWRTCRRCRLGLVAKIRVTDGWQRKGYARRMMERAMRGCESYTWTTSPQSDLGQKFFPALSRATGAAFTPDSRECSHMRAARRGYEPARLEDPPPAGRASRQWDPEGV